MSQKRKAIVVGVSLFALTGAMAVLVILVQLFNIDLIFEAKSNERVLNETVIVEGVKTVASAQPNGDILTGSSSPAKATFSTQGSFESVRADIERTLKGQGFKLAGLPDVVNMYDENDYSVLSGSISSQIIGFAVRAHKGKNSLVINYFFSEPHECNGECGRSFSRSDIGLNEWDVQRIHVVYDDTANNSIFGSEYLE